MSWTEVFWNVNHKGKTLPQVLFSDPDWFFFMIEEGNFNDKGDIAGEARELNFKARNIKIPQGEGEDLVAEYYIHQPTGKFQEMKLVPCSREAHSGSVRSDVIDLSVPRQFSNYDKQGCKSLVSDLEFYFFGDSRYRMTKAKCEEFFDNDDNFML